MMSPLEIIGFITGVIGVFLTTRQSIWCWPVAIANVVIYSFIFYDAHLYADMGLQIIYIGMSVYGWYYWVKGDKKAEEKQVPVTLTSRNWLLVHGAGILLGTLILGYLLQNYTPASLPYLDSFCTAASLSGQFLQARKKLENWLLWIGVDAVYVGLYLLKDLYLTAALYTLFIVLAWIGYRSWKKSLKLPL